MLKSQLIERIGREQNHLTVRDISAGINLIIEAMSQALSCENRIEIRGFGSFSLRHRMARQAHNPKTGEKLITNSKYAVHFKPGKEMRERINASRHLPIISRHGDTE